MCGGEYAKLIGIAFIERERERERNREDNDIENMQTEREREKEKRGRVAVFFLVQLCSCCSRRRSFCSIE